MKSRGGKDYRGNSDFEDIVYIFDNSSDIPNKIQKSDSIVKTYIKDSISDLLKLPFIEEEIISNLEYFSQNFRKTGIIEIWESLINESL